MLTTQVNVREGIFNSPKYSISIEKLEQIGKITLYVISQGYLTLWQCCYQYR